MPSPVLAFVTLLAMLTGSLALAADNQLSEDEKKAGWQLLFNGHDHAGWKCNQGEPIQTPVENGALVPYQSGGLIIIHEKPFGDFVLKCDVRWESEHCNSGIFFRVEDPINPVHTGFEVQVHSGDGTSKHDFGAIYDLVATTENAGKATGEWNTVEITCRGPLIEVVVNDRKVCSTNCDDFDQAGYCPDGEKHKYRLGSQPRAVKNFARKGYLGFQDHGQKVWYKNIKVRELD